MPCTLNHNLICLVLGLLFKVTLIYKALDMATIIMLNYVYEIISLKAM